MKMKIGPYTISKLKNGNVLIMHDSGEGMEVKREVFIQWVEKFWEERF